MKQIKAKKKKVTKEKVDKADNKQILKEAREALKVSHADFNRELSLLKKNAGAFVKAQGVKGIELKATMLAIKQAIEDIKELVLELKASELKD